MKSSASNIVGEDCVCVCHSVLLGLYVRRNKHIERKLGVCGVSVQETGQDQVWSRPQEESKEGQDLSNHGETAGEHQHCPA